MTKKALNSKFAESDHRTLFFLDAVAERSESIIDHSGRRVAVLRQPKDYVIPGVRIDITDGDATMACWVGANEHRLFYIQRMIATADQCREVFAFAFGGAAKVGWTFSYEPTSGEDTSVWGTAETHVPFTSATGSMQRIGIGPELPNLRLTEAGAFWANDVAMMMLSAFRCAQRSGLKSSSTGPRPQ